MNLDQIAIRISNPNSCLPAETPVLQELAEKYPYAQVFSILYLKSLSLQNDIGFDEALQKHAYRVTDRMKLYDLIHDQKQHTEAEVQTEVEAELETTETIELIQDVAVLQTSESSVDAPSEVNQLESIEDENHTVAEEDDLLQEISSEILFEKGLIDEYVESDRDTLLNAAVDIIENAETIEEIESESKDLTEIDEDPVLIEISEEIVEELNLSTPEIEEETNLKAEEFLESKAAEISVENKISDLDLAIISEIVETIYSDNLEQTIQEVEVVEKKSEINQAHHVAEKVEIENSKMSFTSWLRSGNTSAATSASVEIKEKEKEVQQTINQKVDLIENFINTEPKISKVKKEFYSPSKKAKESISTDGLIYSETLAEIFAMQGNFPKAITAYEQLMLTNPEKKIFFAKRIEELKEKLNT
ncbi:MAG: hypothetical protein PHQ74_01120 [Crocinitomicaceae bacterium]|nr:hypothetical protein [Crocinitomicaceae bacterium]